MSDNGNVRANIEDHFLIGPASRCDSACEPSWNVYYDDGRGHARKRSDHRPYRRFACCARSAKSACRNLVEMALKNGGRDNVTVIVARYSISHGNNYAAGVG